MSMTLGDGFNRRKKLAGDLQTWIGRLKHAGATRTARSRCASRSPLVLKDDIIPKLEQAARAIPLRADGVNVIETDYGLPSRDLWTFCNERTS